jgi:hypothetical protein
MLVEWFAGPSLASTLSHVPLPRQRRSEGSWAIGVGLLIVNAVSYGPWASLLILAGACLVAMGVWGRRQARRARLRLEKSIDGFNRVSAGPQVGQARLGGDELNGNVRALPIGVTVACPVAPGGTRPFLVG